MEAVAVNENRFRQKGETATLEEHQQALFELLCEFDRAAGELDVRYFLFAGTLLGAVRHKGFIPWDDDLDVIMMRADYERFMREAQELIDEAFYLQNEFSEHWPMFFSKLRINGTACLEKYHPKDSMIHQGVYMDIFACDNAFDSALGRLLQFACSKVVIAKGLDKEGYSSTSLLKTVFILICRLLPLKPFLRIVKGPRKTKKYVHSFLACASSYAKNVYPGSYFEKSIQLEFENRKFSAPEKSGDVLKTLYGDYMSLPSESDRKVKQHAILVDLKRSYTEYEHYREGMKFDVHTRSIR